MTLGWVGDIEDLTKANSDFRSVLFTGVHAQLTVMCIPPAGEIGWETHPAIDQFLRIEHGRGRVELGSTEFTIDETHEVDDDWAIIVPAGVWHNVVNLGDGDLKLYSVYTPPQHAPGTVHHTKAEADAAERQMAVP